jgi:phosphoenolpyruvate carboxylase
MPKKPASRSSALREIPQLRAEVRALGNALGRVITRLEGRETFDTVEAIRQLAKARRAGDSGAERKLAHAIAALAPPRLPMRIPCARASRPP